MVTLGEIVKDEFGNEFEVIDILAEFDEDDLDDGETDGAYVEVSNEKREVLYGVVVMKEHSTTWVFEADVEEEETDL